MLKQENWKTIHYRHKLTVQAIVCVKKQAIFQKSPLRNTIFEVKP